MSFREELVTLINKHSIEHKSNTADYILADYIIDCLNVFGKTMSTRDKWYGNEQNTITKLEEKK